MPPAQIQLRAVLRDIVARHEARVPSIVRRSHHADLFQQVAFRQLGRDGPARQLVNGDKLSVAGRPGRVRQNPNAQEQVDHHRDAEDHRCAGKKHWKHRQSEADDYERAENRERPRRLAGAQCTARREIETATEKLSLRDPHIEQHSIRLGDPSGEVEVQHARPNAPVRPARERCRVPSESGSRKYHLRLQSRRARLLGAPMLLSRAKKGAWA